MYNVAGRVCCLCNQSKLLKMYKDVFVDPGGNILRHDGGALCWDEFHAVRTIFLKLWIAMTEPRVHGRRGISKACEEVLRIGLNNINFAVDCGRLKHAYPDIEDNEEDNNTDDEGSLQMLLL